MEKKNKCHLIVYPNKENIKIANGRFMNLSKSMKMTYNPQANKLP